MRIAVFADVHGNRTAMDAVWADIRSMAPDVVVHAGDLADTGSRPIEVVDLIQAMNWTGVRGNTDELLCRPASLHEFASVFPGIRPFVTAIEEMAAATRSLLGTDRLAWLAALPGQQVIGPAVIVHASPATTWRGPLISCKDHDLSTTFDPLDGDMVVYGHIHEPFVRQVGRRTFVNVGSVGLSYDGDPRASYALIEGAAATIRRVEYRLEAEIRDRQASPVPHAGWVSRMLRTARPSLPDA